MMQNKKSTIKLEDNKSKRRIIEKASELFLMHGYTRVTMDEICKSLIMSRKTMYKYFSNKEMLLEEVLLNRSRCKGAALDAILQDNSLDFMQRFRKMIEYISKDYPKETIYFMQDVKTNVPDVWKKLVEMRNHDIPIRMGNFLKDGIKKGIIKKNIRADIFIRMHLAVVNELMNPETILELGYNVGDIIEAMDSILFFGIIDQDSPNFKKPLKQRK